MIPIKGYLFIGLALLSIAFTACKGDSSPRYPIQHNFKTTLKLMDQGGNEKNQFSPAEPVTLELSITNVTDSPRTLTLATPQTYEFIVAPSGTTQSVWRWSYNKGFVQVIVELSFAAGETKTYRETWNQTNDAGSAVATGDYVAQGFMWTTPLKPSWDAIGAETDTRSAPVTFLIQ
jgi:hypothetical protein